MQTDLPAQRVIAEILTPLSRPVAGQVEGSLLAMASGADSGTESAAVGPFSRTRDVIGLMAQKPDDPFTGLRTLITRVLESAGAERVFFFDVQAGKPGSGVAPAMGQCLVSVNIDRESIREPELKAPMAFIKRALESRRAIVVPDRTSEGRSDGEPEVPSRGYGAAPVTARGEIVGIVYFDHRFQPLAGDPSRWEEIAVVMGTLASVHMIERLSSENRSLWLDVTSLKEQARNSPAAAGAVPATPRNPVRPRPDRARFKGDYSLIVGSSPPLLEIFQLLDRVSGSSAPVLINGESGTGKELIAQAVHRNSPRSGKPFVSENCGALTETLLESELFGYVRGAFTGANKDSKGLFELADSGTLFLDEVGDMSPSMQKKLLRVLQEGVIRRVGGKDFIHVDVRLVCATNKDLLEECKEGRFREDLYYRLNVINIRLPPLRERGQDIPELVEHFLAEMGRQSGLVKSIDAEALQRLSAYGWPGNIRELQNEVKRLHAMSDGGIRASDLSESILRGNHEELFQESFERQLSELTLRDATERLERELIRRALYAARGNKSLVAQKLKIPKTSLYNKISKYQLEKELP